MTGHDVSRLLLRGSAVALAVTGLAQVLAFAVQVLLARTLGPVEYGYLSVAMAWLSVGLIVGKVGFDTGLVRFIADYVAHDEPASARAAVRHARRLTLVASASLAGLGGSLVLALRPVPTELRWTLLLTAVVLPLAVYSEITAAALRGLRKVGVALAGDGVVRPTVVALIVAVGAGLGTARFRASEAMLAYALGTCASLLVTAHVLRITLPRSTIGAPATQPSLWTRTAVPLMLASGFLTLLYSTDTLMLGWLSNTTDAGYYSVASKLALLVLFAMNAGQTMAAPMLSGAFSTNRQDDLRRIIGTLNIASAAVAVPLTLLVLIFAEQVLATFGADFRSAADCFRILAVMQVLNVLTGPTGTLLTMTGQQRVLVGLLGTALCLNVLLNVALIPAYGTTGAALAALVAHTAWNLVGVVLIRRRLGVDCSIMTAFGGRSLHRS